MPALPPMVLWRCVPYGGARVRAASYDSEPLWSPKSSQLEISHRGKPNLHPQLWVDDAKFTLCRDLGKRHFPVCWYMCLVGVSFPCLQISILLGTTTTLVLPNYRHIFPKCSRTPLRSIVFWLLRWEQGCGLHCQGRPRTSQRSRPHAVVHFS